MSHAGRPIGLAFYTPQCQHPTNEAGWTCIHCRRLAELSPRASKKSKPQPRDDFDDYDAGDAARDAAEREAYLSHAPSETMRSKMATWRAANGTHVAPAPAPETKIINTCRCCGRADTHETWSTLKLLSAKAVTDEGVTTHEEMRNCVCGSTRMVVSEREGLVYYRGGGK